MNKKITFYLLALAIFIPAAHYQWGDSAHSIGMISKSGGQIRHDAFFKPGWGNYTLIATATVIPPYRGDVRVVLEGAPLLEHQIYFSKPALDLGIRRLPRFKDNILYDLQPKDRIALWVVMKPGKEEIRGKYNLVFYDTKDNRPVLTVPLTFADKEEANRAARHQH
ncbi:MAG: hypothetical protein HZA78_09825 [Candidatus Schekmanbacteria bacterium]|nr:hypothetical protein [Candidatus Schekmanbacteria bacterium]